MAFVQSQQNTSNTNVARATISQVRPLSLPATRQHLTLHRGDHLYREGDPMKDFYLVTAGVLKCYRDNGGGEEQVTGFCQAGDFCGFDNLASEKAGNSAVALNTTNLEVFPMRDLDAVPDFSSSFQQEMMHEMSRELQRLMHLLQLERCSAEHRVVSFLLEHSAYEKRRGCVESDFVLPMPRRDLARYLHLASETLSRVLSRLQDEGVLKFCRNRVVLTDIPALQRRLDSEGQMTRSN